jgi:hypothetical protein|tara:strand:+ start:214 stop:891 length:678 start_codon:yes stop_codon:yes gene_type:complete
MKTGKFNASFNEAEALLKKIGVLSDSQHFPVVPSNFLSLCRTKTYADLWAYLYKERIYSFVLYDQSLILIRNNPELSYSFYDTPYDAPSFEEFCERELGELPGAEDQDFFRTDYFEYLDTLLTVRHVSPIRYDYSPGSYRPAVHPSSHVHIGDSSSYRFGCERILTPLAFVKFVIRQAFPKEWEKYLSNLQPDELRKEESSVRSGLEPVTGFGKSHQDRCEMYFT